MFHIPGLNFDLKFYENLELFELFGLGTNYYIEVLSPPRAFVVLTVHDAVDDIGQNYFEPESNLERVVLRSLY